MNLIQTYVDYPSKDVCFRHIGHLLKDAKAFNKSIEDLVQLLPNNLYFNVIGALDARGFIIGTAIQSYLYHKHKRNVGLVMVRKAGKLPGHVASESYSMEYGEPKTLEVSMEDIAADDCVLLVDDLLATGGTLKAAVEIMKRFDAKVTGLACLIQLEGLCDESHFEGIPITTLFKYPATQGEGRQVSKPKLYRPLDSGPGSWGPTALIWHPSLESIALDMINFDVRPCFVHWDSFQDGWCDIKFDSNLKGKHVVFLFSMANKETFAEQLALLVALPRQEIRSLDICIPYLGPGTHERVRFPGMLATAEPMLKALTACLPMTKTGPARLIILDIHALQEQFYVVDNVHVKLVTAIPLLKKEIMKKFGTVAFPDDGAYKRFSEQFKGHPTIICGKMRNGDTREIRILDYVNWPKEFLPEEVIIVDDLVQSGETMLKCVDAIKARFPGIHVDGYATHAVFPNEAWRKVIPKFRKFYLTDSNPAVISILRAYRDSTDNRQIVILPVKAVFDAYNPNYGGGRLRVWHVASTNEQKLEAVHQWCNGLVLADDGCMSKVPEQPFGMEQIEQGARNRLAMCTGSSRVAIENGIVKNTENEYHDVAFVIISLEYEEYTASCAVIIPPEYNCHVEDAIRDPSKTFGSRVEEAMGFPKGTWHEHLTPITRVTQIGEALKNTGFNKQI